MCGNHPILRPDDDFKKLEGARMFPFTDKMPIVSDFFHVDCKANDGSSYYNLHMGLKYDPLLHTR